METQQSNSPYAVDFINQWNATFGQKVFNMPHLAVRSLHTCVGYILRNIRVNFRDATTDLRDSSIIMQSSGTGKKPTIEFVEDVVTEYDPKCKWRRRTNITSAGAVGTVSVGDILDSETGCKMKAPIVAEGDLKNLDLLTCSEADNILYSKVDSFGNDLLTNLCESQDPDNLISKKLANGEVTPFTSHITYFLTTTVPNFPNPRWFDKGLFQRHGVAIKNVPFEDYVTIRDELLDNTGLTGSSEKGIKDLVLELQKRKVPEKFQFSKEINELTKDKASQLDGMLIGLNNDKILNQLKSFTTRMGLKMVTYGCHHAFLDNRDFLTKEDVDYAFGVSKQSWDDILNFIGYTNVKIASCSEATIKLMQDGNERSTEDVYQGLRGVFTRNNVKYALSTMAREGKLFRTRRDTYNIRKLDS